MGGGIKQRHLCVPGLSGETQLEAVEEKSCPQLLPLPAPEINEALEAIGEISHAENMEYSSDAHSSQPATATQALLTNLGVCLEGGGGRTGCYIGTSDIDTVALW